MEGSCESEIPSPPIVGNGMEREQSKHSFFTILTVPKARYPNNPTQAQ